MSATRAKTKSPAKVKTIGKIAAWRPSGPVRAILNSELRGNRNITSIIERLIIEGAKAKSKYPKLVERFEVIQEEASC